MRPGNQFDSTLPLFRRNGIVSLAAGVLATATLASPAHAVSELRLTNQAQASSTPAIAYGAQGHLSVAWSDTRDGNSEIYYCALDLWGNRLTPDVRVTNTAAASGAPRLGVDAEGNVYLVWREANNAYVSKLDWQGNALVPPKGVNLDAYVVFQNPDISVPATGGCAVGVGARAGGTGDLWVIRFDASLNQGCRTSALFINATASNGPRVSIETSPTFSSNLTFWRESINPFDYGNSLSTITATSGCGRGSRTDHCGGNSFPTLDSHGHGIVFERSSKVWLTSGSGCGQQLSENPGPSVSPAAAVLGPSGSIAVWSDRRGGTSDLYYATYTSSFVKDGADVAFVTGSSNATFPAVCADGLGTAFVAWQDDRDGNAEIYFARTPEPPGYGTIEGTVYNAVTGQPLPFAFVDVVEPEHATIVSRRFVAGADGRYRIAGLSPAGPWALVAGRDGFTSPQTSGVEVPAGQTVTVDLRVSTGTVISGTIRDAFNGLPIRGAHVRADSSGGQPTRSLETGPDGRYRFDVYPGTYDLRVDVPAVGEAGPYLSLEHPYYKPVTRPFIDAGPAPRDEAIALESNTVVLVHGIFNRADDWGTVLDPEPGDPPSFRRELEQDGWHTEALTYDWTRSIEEAGGQLDRWLGSKPFASSRAVAHSMGGLTTRWCAEQIAAPIGGRPFSKIVTMGTLHHGTPLSSNLQALVKGLDSWPFLLLHLPDLPSLADLAVEAAIQRWAPCFNDFEPGSDRLNLLNYGVDTPENFDGPMSCGEGAPEPTHAPEDLLSGVAYVAFAGDNPQNLKFLAKSFMNDCPSDGAVPVHSAKLYRQGPAVSSFVTSCFDGTDCDVRHEPQGVPGGRPPAGTAAIELRSSACVRSRVLMALRGEPISCGPRPQVAVGAATPDSAVVAMPGFGQILAPGDSMTRAFEVAPGGRLSVLVQWRQDRAEFDLEDPSGARIDSAACVGVPGRLFESNPGAAWSRMEIDAAPAGTWTVRLRSLSGSPQQVSATPFVSSDVVLTASASPRLATPGAPVRVIADLRRSGAPLPGAAVEGILGDPSGASSSFSLVDDGTGGDLVPGDALYTGVILPDSSGAYAVSITASGGAGLPYGARTATTGFTAAPGLDVALPPSSISAPRSWAYPSDVLSISFRVRNSGPLVADSVWILVRDDSAGTTVLDTIATVPAGDSLEFVAPWKATQPGLHGLRFQARALGPVVDLDRTNSSAWRGFEIVPFGSAPSIVSAPPAPARPIRSSGFPSRVLPNPSRGTSVIEFDLPGPADDVVLTILDVAGRRMATLRLGRLAAGLHRVPWRPTTHGASWSSSILFYRIQAGAASAGGRIVTVR